MRQPPITELLDCPRCRRRDPVGTRTRPVDLEASTTLVVTLRGPQPMSCTCAPTTPPHRHAECPRCGAEFALVAP